MTRFKFICEQMESKFFKVQPSQSNSGSINHVSQSPAVYIMGTAKPTCIDYVFYQELLSAMILSGNGSQFEFFSADTATRLYKLINLTKWYRAMSQDKHCKMVSDRFIQEMRSKKPSRGGKKKENSKQRMQEDDDSQSNERKDHRKSVKFAMDRSVKFRDEQEEIE